MQYLHCFFNTFACFFLYLLYFRIPEAAQMPWFVPPPGRRRAGWVATIIGVGLAASALSLALGGGGLALKAAAALALELRMARPASHHPPTPHGPPRPVGFCCTTASSKRPEDVKYT